MGAGAFGGLLVLGLILMIAGTMGFFLSDPTSSPIGWTVLFIIGFLMLIGGIIFLVMKQSSSSSATTTKTR
jgi:hypothetical protein